MSKYQLIHELCESRIFRSKQAMGKYSVSDANTLFYAVLLSTLALSLHGKTNRWARGYASKSAAFGNFKFFRPTATDLYVLTHMALHVNGSVGLIVGRSLLRLYKGLGKGSVDSQLAEQTLLRLERSLQIKDARLRQARRVLTHWGTSSEDEQKNTTTNLHRIVRMYAKLAEVLPYLQSAVAREPGHFGKMTVGQTALAIAGAGLAGVALGLQYDPNKRWRIFRDSTVFDGSKILTEDRPTQLFHIVQNLKHHPDIEKIISVHYLADGITSLVRSTANPE